MTYVNIFLVCSAEDLHEDSLEITDFISTLNNLYVEHDLYFNLSICEDEDKAAEEVEKQKQGNQGIQDSQLFVIVFYKKAGQYAVDKFNEAYNQFQDSGSPAILTFFRIDDSDPSTEVKDFMDRLDQELGHYFKTYTDIDALKLYLLMQIKSMGLDSGIVFEDGQAYVQNEPILSVEHLPELAKNLDWRKFRKDREKIEEEFVEAQAAYLSDTNNEDAYNRFIEVANRRNNLKKQIKQLENDILDLTCMSVEDSAKGNMTARQREAYRLLERGKYRKADAILDEKEIFADAENAISLKHSADERMNQQLECYVDEILSKIDIKMTLVKDISRIRKVDELYEKAVKLEEEENLNPKATQRYIKFLEAQGKYLRAIPLARRYMDHISQTGNFEDIIFAKVSLASLLMKEKYNADSLKEAEELYYEALDIIRKLVAEDPEIFEKDLAIICNDLAFFIVNRRYSDEKRLEEAEALYREALNINRKLAEENQGNFEEDLARSCHTLADFLKFYSSNNEETEALYREELDILVRLDEIDPEIHKAKLATSCYSLATFLYGKNDINEWEEAEELLRDAIGIQEELTAEDPVRNELKLALSYDALSVILDNNYEDSDSKAELIEILCKSLDIYRRLSILNPNEFEGNYAKNCYTLAGMLADSCNTESQAKAEDLYHKALDIYARILTGSFDAESVKETEDLYCKALDIYQSLTDESPEPYQKKYAEACNGLGELLACCHDEGKLDEAEHLFRMAIEVRKKLASKDPQKYEADLTASCNALERLLARRKEEN